MGIDFLRRSAPSFHRALDRQAVALRTPTLFSSDIPDVARTASADICDAAPVGVGERLLIRVLDQKLVGQRENLVVLQFENPPAEYLARVQAGAGVELGEVKAIRPLSGVAEVALCD